jgi:hypothetical protein
MNQTQITVYDIVMRVGIVSAHQHLKTHYPDVYKDIEKSYGDRFAQKLYSYLYNLTQNPKCLQCNHHETKFISLYRGYRFFCGNACVAHNKAHERKKKMTTAERYDCEKPTQNPEIEDKRKKTLIRKYGTANLAQIRWNRKNT